LINCIAIRTAHLVKSDNDKQVKSSCGDGGKETGLAEEKLVGGPFTIGATAEGVLD
jgi:hypothetical protein